MPAPDSVKQLIETFDNNIDFYKSDRYNEAQLRQEFLDPFFKELGWDMDNTAGFAPQYRDVIHEASIKIGGSTKAPDYAFSIHGQYKFFLEAKKPAVNVHIDTDPAYQLRRYGWSAKLPISILTDFEEFAIYDCRKRPKRDERASTSRLAYFKYTDYIEKWDELCATFSKEAILKGSFDKYTVDTKRHRGTETVDDAFLEEIENWRNLLARNFALRNSTLSVRDLNFAVQKTIDRLIFLRFCEDRGIEEYKRLATLLNGGRIYPRLLDQFMQADARYNSGLFHFSDESGRGAPDNITPNLELDDKVLKEIISKLYYPESPYEFSVMPADILGQVYEQFLGKTIRLTQEHRAKIEEKPEVRKAGGVYYTPSYIVDYIVKNTLGHMLDGSDPDKPKPIAVSKAAEIKVLDLACGSGSFLIVAYQYLLDWHLRQYTSDPETKELDQGKIKRHSGGKNPKIYPSPDEAWTLTTDERKRILLNSIFGVDIDAQAVEVTKLSLLLKVIEGETHQIKQRDWIRERQRILPDLGNNIKCGNSLIDPDFYDNEQMLLLDEETQHRINVFDWSQNFPEIMNGGGFNCIIGNPPYIRIQAMREWAPQEVEWLKVNYKAAASGNFDIYVCFIEKAVHLLCEEGAFGLIVPNKFISTDYGKPLRSILIEGRTLTSIHDFLHHQVFDATIYTLLLFGFNSGKPKILSYSTSKASEIELEKSKTRMVPYEQLSESGWDFSPAAERELRNKINAIGVPLLELPATMSRGLSTGSDPTYLIENSSVEASEAATKIPIFATDFRRYSFKVNSKKRLIAPYKVYDHAIVPMLESDFEELAPSSFQRLTSSRVILEKRKQFPKWYLFSAVRSLNNCAFADILVPLLADKGRFCLLPDRFKGEVALMASGGFAIRLLEGCKLDKRYVLGIINSKLLFWELSNTSNVFRGGWITCTKQYFGKLPIRPIDFDNSDDVAKHDKMVLLVERMLELNEKKADENNPETLRLLETQISATDCQIDRLVYDLYDLTPEEIELVE